jgi:cytochrome P450 family 103
MSTNNLQVESGLSQPPTLSLEELNRDPHGIFRHYRPLTPLLKREDGSYIVIRASDVERLATDPRTRQPETDYVERRGIRSGPLFEFFRDTMLMANGSVHRNRRAPMSRTFAFRIISDLRPRIRATANKLLDSHYDKGEMNFADDYAALIPARTISDILGVPEADIPVFTGWVYGFTRILSSSFRREDIPGAIDAKVKLTDYVAALLAERRSSPGDDFLTTYAGAVDEDGHLSPEEIVSQVFTVIVAGSETTRSAMAMQVALLLEHRDQWNAVCHNASLIPGAVLEGLRYEPSVGSFVRFTIDDIEIGGQHLPAGQILTLSTMSALRDPAVYTNPDRFDIRRADHPRWHAVFGAGAHRCLGEALAKAELEEGLLALTARMPGLELAGEPPKMNLHSGARQISGMRVAWRL